MAEFATIGGCAPRSKIAERLERGDDGTRRDGLHATFAAMFTLSGSGILPCATTRLNRSYSGKTEEARACRDSSCCRRVSRSSRTHSVATAAAPKEKARDARGCRSAGVKDVALSYDFGGVESSRGITGISGAVALGGGDKLQVASRTPIAGTSCGYV